MDTPGILTKDRFASTRPRLPICRGSVANETPGSPRFWRIRIGSAIDGTVTAFIPDPAERGGTSGAEGVAVDADGNIYGAEVGPRDVKKYIPR